MFHQQNALEFNNLEGFHGTGAFNISKFPTWDGPLVEMINRPLEVMVVSVKTRARSHRGWSNNAYLDSLAGKIDAKSERSKDNPYLEEVSSRKSWRLRTAISLPLVLLLF